MRNVADLLRKSADRPSIPEGGEPGQALKSAPNRGEVVPGPEAGQQHGGDDIAAVAARGGGPSGGLGVGVRGFRRLLGFFRGRGDARAGEGGGGATPGRCRAGFGCLRRSWNGRLHGPLARAEIVRRGPAPADTGLERGYHRHPHAFHRPDEGQQKERKNADNRTHEDFPLDNQPCELGLGFLEFG